MTRGEMAAYGDNFGLFPAANPSAVPGPAAPGRYFSDEPNTDQFFIYIQKMRELPITNGRTTTYGPNSSLQRQDVATLVVRALHANTSQVDVEVERGPQSEPRP